MTNQNVEQWGLFEITLPGPTAGNSYLDVQLSAQFTSGQRVFTPDGFYDGEGSYRLRFMPDAPGKWTYITNSNAPELAGKIGEFTCVPAGPGNHGPVHVTDTFHFSYDDGTRYYPFGTTCYAWAHQGDALEEQTLQTLRQAAFNKLRMCVFPKFYPFNENEPVYYPFERNAVGEPDFTRFNPAFFQHFEKRVAELGQLGIEADLIVFHPYDHWGYSTMDAESDYRYLRYLIARLAAYRNVWWSLANEYDFMLDRKPMEQWDEYFRILVAKDPYQHPRSIHNGDTEKNYDHTQPWVTHVCIQNWDVKQVKRWRRTYQKPILNDELEYEGDIVFPWGNISAQEEVHRIWIMVTNGGYAGHGETYMHPEDILWWSKGGVLHGESWQRVAFLRKIMEDGPVGGLTPLEDQWVWSRVSGGQNGAYRLLYFGEHQPQFWCDGLPETDDYEIDIIDTWAMTITPGTRRERRHFAAQGAPKPSDPRYELVLPGKPYLAVRIRPR
ncbi:MAG TPA: DUF5060 domain-containing protein [Phototrophicaceae bacterium]|nr:DUF5060 domain-containing protein [Phototrophicaceae bacterium]